MDRFLDLEEFRFLNQYLFIGYLILAGAAVNHWLLGGSQSRPGRLVMIALFTAGLVTNISFIFEIDALVQVATLLEVAAIVTMSLSASARNSGGARV